jgi:probable FeS assembly SUF system protein SufT
MSQKEITLIDDCNATRIPSGEEVLLPAGSEYVISQALGGSITLRGGSGLFRVAQDQAAALGPEAAEAFAETDRLNIDASEFSEDGVWDALRQCFDPEIPINIVDLGLIYSLNCLKQDSGKYHVDVKMTLTATGCGMGPTIAADARDKIEQLPFIDSANVEIVWDPQWTPHMISEEGRKILGLS